MLSTNIHLVILCILKLTFKPSTMKPGKVWFFLVVAVLVATAVSSKQVSGTGGQELEQTLPNHSGDTPANEVTPKRPALNGPSNQSEFTGNWNSSLKNNDHSNTPNRIRLNFNTLPQERSQDISKKAVRARSFSKALFEHAQLSVPIRDHALDTKFIKGMALGSLKASQFGGYMIQDTAYLDNAGKVYSEAAQKMEEQGKYDFALFYREQAAKYDKYHKEFLETWKIESAEAVHVGPAVQAYMAFQQVVAKQHPKYVPVAMLPCTMLWPWMAGSLIGGVDKQNPYYEDWFKQNLREPGTQSSTEKFVDKYFTPDDEGPALKIFCEGMMNELNFFREACDEAPFKLSDICPRAG